MRFCFDPSSTAFSHRCVFDEKAQSISVDRRPKNIIMESLSFTCTTNVRFKLRISGNRKSADKNDSKQFLWIKKLREATNLCVQIMNSKTTSKGETWSRGINLRLPKLDFSSVCVFKRNVWTGPNWSRSWAGGDYVLIKSLMQHLDDVRKQQRANHRKLNWIHVPFKVNLDGCIWKRVSTPPCTLHCSTH